MTSSLPQHPETPSREGRGRFTQEKTMAALALVFVAGVVGLTVVPEPWNAAVTSLVILVILWVMFR